MKKIIFCFILIVSFSCCANAEHFETVNLQIPFEENMPVQNDLGEIPPERLEMLYMKDYIPISLLSRKQLINQDEKTNNQNKNQSQNQLNLL